MNDFLNGWGSGMTGSGGGNPSQSVLEKMGRDAAANHWNNNNNHRPAGGATASGAPSGSGTPVTTLLYQAGKRISGKKLLLHFAIAAGLILLSIFLAAITPRSLDWVAELVAIPSWLLMMWVFVRLPFYGIAKIGSLFEKKKTQE
jgi:hypothetical protein